MKKRTASMASNHHTFRVAPADASLATAAATEPAPEALIRAIEFSLKKQLLKSTVEQEAIEITASGLRPICLVVRRFGATALVAGLLRGREKVVESLTVCRAGFDAEEDEAALDAARTLILDDVECPETRAFVEQMIDEARAKPRPLAIHIHLDERNFLDPSVRIVTHCVAESFFDQFGLEKLHFATDV